jgi:hypothetical protein
MTLADVEEILGPGRLTDGIIIGHEKLRGNSIYVWTVGGAYGEIRMYIGFQNGRVCTTFYDEPSL